MKPRFGAQGSDFYGWPTEAKSPFFFGNRKYGAERESTERNPKDAASSSFPLSRHGVVGSSQLVLVQGTDFREAESRTRTRTRNIGLDWCSWACFHVCIRPLGFFWENTHILNSRRWITCIY